MSDDLQLAGLSQRTHDGYLRWIRQLADYCQTTPDAITEDQLRRIFLHLKHKRKFASGSLSVAVSGLMFFFRVTCPQEWPSCLKQSATDLYRARQNAPEPSDTNLMPFTAAGPPTVSWPLLPFCVRFKIRFRCRRLIRILQHAILGSWLTITQAGFPPASHQDLASPDVHCIVTVFKNSPLECFARDWCTP